METGPPWLAEWPSVLALPLRDYLVEDYHPVLKLWHACDFVELMLRLSVAMGVGDLRRRGELSPQLLRALRPIVAPTLGHWHQMAQAVASHVEQSQESVISELPEWVRKISGLLDGPVGPIRSPETSFTQLRHRLAHGGGVTRTVAANLTTVWEPAIAQLLEQIDWLRGVQLVVRTEHGFGLLRGAKTTVEPYSADNAATLRDIFRQAGDQAVVLVRGSRMLHLWPLTLYGLPRSEDPQIAPAILPAPQVYVRYDSARVYFTPIGSEELSQSQADAEVAVKFKQLFRLESSSPERLRWQVQGFEDEILRTAHQVVGRQADLEALHQRAAESGVVWVHGPAGIGKSYLVAKLVARWLTNPCSQTEVLAYRFKGGDIRCSRASFLGFCIERLESVTGSTPTPNLSPLIRLRRLLEGLRDQRVLFILDGLDEIAERDPTFALDVPLALRLPDVCWLCFGRPTPALEAAFHQDRCHRYSLGPMLEGDIRTMLLEKIGPLRKRLLKNDFEKGEQIINPFIQKVFRAADGLPLYVKFVVGDILNNRFRALDAGERLPATLADYYRDLLGRCGVGELQLHANYLLGILALAREPLSVEALASLLRRRNAVLQRNISQVQEALAMLGPMTRVALTQHGGEGYVLFHHSLVQHILKNEPSLAMEVRGWFVQAVLNTGDDAITPYLYDHGIYHLVSGGHVGEALALLSDTAYLEKRFQILKNDKRYDPLSSIGDALVEAELGPDVELALIRLCRTQHQAVKELVVDVLTRLGPQKAERILARLNATSRRESWSILGADRRATAEILKITMEVASRLHLDEILAVAILRAALHRDLALRAMASRFAHVLWKRDQARGLEVLELLAIRAVPGLPRLPNRTALDSFLMLSNLMLFEPKQDPAVLRSVGDVWRGVIQRLLGMVLVGKWLLPRFFNVAFALLKHHPQLGTTNEGQPRDVKAEFERFFQLAPEVRELYRRLVGYLDAEDFPSISPEMEQDYLAATTIEDFFVLVGFLLGLLPRVESDPLASLPLLRKLFDKTCQNRQAHPYLADVTAALQDILDKGLLEGRVVPDEVFEFFVQSVEACHEVFEAVPQAIRLSTSEAPKAVFLGPYALHWFERHGTLATADLLQRRLQEAMLEPDLPFFRVLFRLELPFIALLWRRPRLALLVLEMFLKRVLETPTDSDGRGEVMDMAVSFLIRLRAAYRDKNSHESFLGPHHVDEFLQQVGAPSDICSRVRMAEPRLSLGDFLDGRCWIFLRDQVIWSSPRLRGKLIQTFQHAADCRNLNQWLGFAVRQFLEEVTTEQAERPRGRAR